MSIKLENEAAARILDRLEKQEMITLPSHLWERDLLELARRYPVWRDIANCCGFTNEKIDAGWPHADAGSKVKMPTFRIVKARLACRAHERQAQM